MLSLNQRRQKINGADELERKSKRITIMYFKSCRKPTAKADFCQNRNYKYISLDY